MSVKALVNTTVIAGGRKELGYYERSKSIASRVWVMLGEFL